MLRCIWQAMDPLSIHVTFTAIVPGAYQGEAKMCLRLSWGSQMPPPAKRVKATTYRRDSPEVNCALGWLQKLTHVPLAIAILLVLCWIGHGKYYIRDDEWPQRGRGQGYVSYFWSNGTDTRVPQNVFLVINSSCCYRLPHVGRQCYKDAPCPTAVFTVHLAVEWSKISPAQIGYSFPFPPLFPLPFTSFFTFSFFPQTNYGVREGCDYTPK